MLANLGSLEIVYLAWLSLTRRMMHFCMATTVMPEVLITHTIAHGQACELSNVNVHYHGVAL